MEFITYRDYRGWSQNEFNKLPLMFAFCDKQLEEVAKKHGYNSFDDMAPDLYGLSSIGGFYFKKDSEHIHEVTEGINRKLEELIAADKTGEGFIYTMFRYELANHEYGYTREIDSTLSALGYDVKDINKDKRLLRGLKKAMKEIMEEED